LLEHKFAKIYEVPNDQAHLPEAQNKVAERTVAKGCKRLDAVPFCVSVDFVFNREFSD